MIFIFIYNKNFRLKNKNLIKKFLKRMEKGSTVSISPVVSNTSLNEASSDTLIYGSNIVKKLLSSFEKTSISNDVASTVLNTFFSKYEKELKNLIIDKFCHKLSTNQINQIKSVTEPASYSLSLMLFKDFLDRSLLSHVFYEVASDAILNDALTEVELDSLDARNLQSEWNNLSNEHKTKLLDCLARHVFTDVS